MDLKSTVKHFLAVLAVIECIAKYVTELKGQGDSTENSHEAFHSVAIRLFDKLTELI